MIPLRPRCARLAALTARIAIRFLATIEGHHTDVLDDVERRRYCLIIFAGCPRSPLHIARCGAHSDRRSQATIRSPHLKPHPGRLFVRRHVRKPTIEPDCLSASGQAQIRPSQSSRRCHGGTPVRSRCVGAALSAPITVNNSGIDARNRQAYPTLPSLCNALCALAEGREPWPVVFLLEPEEFELSFTSGENQNRIVNVLRFPDGHRGSEPSEVVFAHSGTSQEVVLSFWRALRQLETFLTEDDFTTNWGEPFPAHEMAALTAAVERIKTGQ